MIVELESNEIDLVIGGQSAVILPGQDFDPAGFLEEVFRQELFTGAPPGASG